MPALRIAISIAWISFGVYWLASAFAAKQGRASRRRIPLDGLIALSVVLLVRVFHGGSLAVHSPVLGAIGAVVFASGIALAIWARVHLGRNWGMPMTQKAEPELVTSGPYRFVRHPIYSGLLAGVLGTALVTNLIGLIIVAVLPFWNQLRQQPLIQSCLRGVNAAVIGVLVAAFIRPVWSSAVHSAFDLVITLAAFGLLVRWKVSSWIVVAAVASVSAIASII